VNSRFSLLLMLVTLAAGATEPIVVASKNFTENRLLGEIMAQLIEARTELEVTRKINLGGTMVVFGALEVGEVDLYPDYTGTGWSIVLKREERAPDPLKTYITVKRAYEQRFGVTWLAPFGFSNSYAVAMREDLAERLDVTRVSQLAEHGDDLTVGWSLEFMNREDGWPGLSEHYGLEIAGVRSMEHGLAYQAILSEQIDVTDAYTTDGKLLRFPLRLLEDDLGFFPPYDCAPIIRTEVLDAHPELGPLLEELAYRLDNDRMQQLNYAVEEENRPFEAVAHDFLVEEGLMTDTGKQFTTTDSLLDFIAARGPITLKLAGEHLFMTGIAVLLAILIAVPLGILLTRFERATPTVMGLTGIIQTIPSLAMLAFMISIPFLGLGIQSAILALFLYALLPLVRNTYTGIREVDAGLIEAATGMGLRDREILRLVQLPLAIPTIMAGLRTATVISVGVATLAAFIGAGGLGEPIAEGLYLNDTRLIMAGAVPAAALALIVDAMLGLVERRLTPGR